MQGSLAATALLMGIVGGPHCVAMCGAACAGIGRAAQGRSTLALCLFQLGRVVGYSALGALAGGSMQGLGWLTTQSAAVRPLWTLLHVAALAVGMVLLFNARQPAWIESSARALWTYTRGAVHRHRVGAPLLVGTLWALLPCGLLYSALLVAGLSARPADGALVMALFALGTSVSMLAGPWLWLRLRGREGLGSWGVRLAGVTLAASAAWALWMGLVHDTAPWCVTS